MKREGDLIVLPWSIENDVEIVELLVMPKCKYCGNESVTWVYLSGRWVMHDKSSNTPHKCLQQKNQGENDMKLDPNSGQAEENMGEIKMDPKTGDAVEESILDQMNKELEQEGNGSPDDNSQQTQGNGENQDNTEGNGEEKEGAGQNNTPRFKDLPKPIRQSLKNGHHQSVELYLLLASGMKVYVSGPAGSGKTTAFKIVTPALGHYFGREDYEFYFKSVCDLTGKHEFEGFINAAGQIVDTDFRKAYTEGHLYLIDEIDAANPNVLTVLNATIENGWASFPDGKVPQHPHFRIGVAANTVGLGSDAIYIGRNPLDGAFRNRFYFLPWEYDHKLELRLAGVDQKEWVERVWLLRAAHQSLGKLAPRIVISPRASIHGATLLRNKITTSTSKLEDALIWQGCSEDEKKRVLEAVKNLKAKDIPNVRFNAAGEPRVS